jgi:hypothetical protein
MLELESDTVLEQREKHCYWNNITKVVFREYKVVVQIFSVVIRQNMSQDFLFLVKRSTLLNR